MTPQQIRDTFSNNLQKLIPKHTNITHLSKELGIHRTQFNRYRFGQSWPQPDVLYRICEYFDTDARILTTPLEEIE